MLPDVLLRRLPPEAIILKRRISRAQAKKAA
jgi:hypothetical protein